MTTLKNIETKNCVLFSTSELSLSFPASFTDEDGVRFNSAEQYVIYHKALFSGDEKTAARLLATDIPAQHRALEAQITGFDAAAWDVGLQGVLYQANFLKFSQNPHLFDVLMQSGNKQIAFADARDTVLGIGLAASDPQSVNPAQWRGDNLLGNALAVLRHDFAKMDFKPVYNDDNRFVISLYDDKEQRMLYFSLAEVAEQMGVTTTLGLFQRLGEIKEMVASISLEKQGETFAENTWAFLERNEETLFAAAVKDADPKTYASYKTDPYFKKKFGY